ncbi:hypothetical protein [Streptomyces olivoreticuli]|uniref:hypothetical protein n=1 Tax=Streptomyces olivoreticuli TaxID=68246 RepID=UPI000E2414CE|nr:hypothetical protein [Streptomyces olivoreticuli]
MTHDTEPTGRTLPDAMGYLVASSAPQPWREAVARAAQLLTPGWDNLRGQGSLLGTLALALYTLAHERQQPPADVPVEVVKEALEHQEQPHTPEPYELQQRMKDALTATGQVRSGPDLHETPVWRVYRGLVHVWHPEVETSDWEPGPSEMSCAVQRLRELMAGLDADRAMLLPEAPEPTGPIRITVTSWVRTVRYGGASAASISVRCPTCNALEGGTLLVDGPDATCTCANGHTFTQPTLSGPHIRNALAQCVYPEGDTRVPGGASGSVTVQGEFRVASSSMPEHADPWPAWFV